MTLVRRTILELRALPRARHAWPAILAVAVLNALFALVLAPATGIMGFSMVALAAIPTAMAPLAAASFASLRADRLSDRLHTAGVATWEILLPRALALLAAGGLYLLSLAPFYLALGASMGVAWPEGATRWYFVGAGLVVWGVAAGLLLATLFPGAKGAPAALAGGVTVFSLLAGVLKGLLVDALGPGLAMRALHLLPHVALFEGAGFAYGSPLRGADPARSQVAFVLYVACMLVAAVAIRARYQNATGWRLGSRRGVLLALALVALLPVGAASGEYEPRERGRGAAPSLDAIVVPRGAPFEGFEDLHVFAMGETSAADVLVEKPRGWVDGARIVVKGSAESGARLAGAARVEGELLRIPVSLAPHGLSGTGLEVQLVGVRLELPGGAMSATASFGAEGADPTGVLLLAGAPGVAAAALGLVARRRSVAA